ncbi:MAG TPA: GNA1162 family protein, partial [Anaeromyxobacteraceae bacterium]|nr:GNA1162 family protein [Anaeromyxobacteraceae bacterium]
MTHRSAPIALLVLAACATPGSGRYQDKEMDFAAIRTVAILPLTNLSRDSAAADRVRDVLANMLLATGALYVVPQGEVMRGLGAAAVAAPASPAMEEVVKLGKVLKADALLTGVIKEYGEVRSGSASGNIISMSLQMQETATGKVVWSASTTKGG